MRIQILPLPAVMNGDDLEEPFALVFDQAEDGIRKELLGEFARQCGARTFVIVPQTVEVVDQHAADEPTVDEDIVKFADEVARRLARHYGGWYPARIVGTPARFDLEQRLQNAGERARQALGIDGTMGDAQDVAHTYDDHEGAAPYCVVCGLARIASVHLRCRNCGKSYLASACGPGHAMEAREIEFQQRVAARWPKLQRDRSEDDL